MGGGCAAEMHDSVWWVVVELGHGGDGVLGDSWFVFVVCGGGVVVVGGGWWWWWR